MEPQTVYLIGLAGVGIILLAVLLHKNHIKQGWGTNDIGMGAYDPAVDPTAYGLGTVWTYTPKNTGEQDETKVLVAKWYNFESRLKPEVAGAIYALFPDLETPQAVSYYGLSDGMVRVLRMIGPKLSSPQTVNTKADVDRLFLGDALKVFNKEQNEKPLSGLYEHPAEYDGYIDVV